jgi:hypothetical protein
MLSPLTSNAMKSGLATQPISKQCYMEIYTIFPEHVIVILIRHKAVILMLLIREQCMAFRGRHGTVASTDILEISEAVF